jgi:DNA-binding transcriptional LysR family regulator
VTRAAEALCLTQPAVTQHVKALERELGVALFERTERGMRLTPSGAILRDYAQRSLSLLDECRHHMADLASGSAGRVALGAGVTTSIFHMPGWLREFRQRYPGIEVTVRTGRSQEIAASVLDRSVDIGVVTSPVQHSGLRVVSLFDEEIALVTPPDHPLADRVISREEFEAAPLILFSQGTGFRAYLTRALRDALLSATVKMESDSVEAIKSFVAVGLGISFLPVAAVQEEVEAGTLARSRVEGLPPLTRTTAAILRADRYLGAGARGFLEMLCARYAVEV